MIRPEPRNDSRIGAGSGFFHGRAARSPDTNPNQNT